jgi:hypothetical protein
VRASPIALQRDRPGPAHLSAATPPLRNAKQTPPKKSAAGRQQIARGHFHFARASNATHASTVAGIPTKK